MTRLDHSPSGQIVKNHRHPAEFLPFDMAQGTPRDSRGVKSETLRYAYSALKPRNDAHLKNKVCASPLLAGDILDERGNTSRVDGGEGVVGWVL